MSSKAAQSASAAGSANGALFGSTGNDDDTALDMPADNSRQHTLPLQHRKRWPVRSSARPYILGALVRLIVLVLCIVAMFILSVLIIQPRMADPYNFDALSWKDWPQPSPQSYLSPLNSSFPTDYNVFLEAHAHTVYSDGRLKPAQILEYALANGFNAIVVSDHNTISGARAAVKVSEEDERFKGKIIVIPAMEYSCCRIHMNFIGVNETIFPVSAWPTNEQLKADIKRAHDAGGIVIVNHISWSNATSTGFQVATLPNHPSVLELFEIGIDGVEVLHNDELDVYSWELIKQQRTALNSSSPLPSPPFPASPSSASDAPRYRTQPLLALSGMDWHYASPTYGWNVLKASNFSREAIMAELRAGRTSILAQQAGVRLSTAYPYSRPYYIFGPLSNLADYFGNFYTSRNGMPSFVNSTMCQTGGGVTVESGLIGATVVTLLILFVIYEAVRFTVLWLMRRFLPRVEHYFKDE